MLGLAAAVAATQVAVAHGEAVWVCLPAALMAVAGSQGRRLPALVTAVMVAAAFAPSLLGSSPAGEPSPLLVLLVALACTAILVGTRERLERERDALGASAMTDALTGVANRRRLLTQADYEIARHRRARRPFALVMLDLDGFKPLNDRFGHAAGDELLTDVAGALSRAMRAQDTVARYGGDEFCVLAPETGSAGADRLEARVGEAVRSVVAGPATVSASVGVAIFPDDGVDVARLLGVADARLLDAKRGRGVQRRAA